MGPIDYTGAFRGLRSPSEEMFRGYQMQAAIRDDRQQQEQRAMQIQAAMAQAEAQKRMQAELQAVASNPTTEGIARLSIAYPQLSEKFKHAHGMLSEEQQRNKLEFGTRALGAAMAGQKELASSLFEERAKALENSGDKQGAAEHRMLAKWVSMDPKSFQTSFGVQIAGALGPDKFAEAFGKFGAERRAEEKQPSEVLRSEAEALKATAEVPKARADAAAAQIAANNAPTRVALENENTASTIRARESDAQMKRIETELKVKEAAAARELDPAKKAKLEAETEEIRAKVMAARQGVGESAQRDYDASADAMRTLDRIKTHPGFREGLSAKMVGGPGTIAGVMYSKIPGTDVADLESLFSTLRGQQFMSNIDKMKGMGQLTEAEGRRLEELAGQTTMRLSIGQLNQNMAEIEATLKRAQSRAVQKLPESGGAVLMNHPKFGRIDEGRVNQLMKQHNATREQVLQFLGAK